MVRGYEEALWRIEKARATGATELDLMDLGLEELPSEIGELVSLRGFDLDGNALPTLPESVGKLEALTVLDLRRNGLTTLPESIGNLEALTQLDLSHNGLTTLPETISKLGALTTLDLSQNRLTTLPETIGELEALIGLDLSQNKLTTLPETIGGLTALRSLNLESNRLSALTIGLANLLELEKLSLRGNPLPPAIQLAARTDVATLQLRLLESQGAETRKEPRLEPPHILRSIEFPPEYKSAGVTILSHFSEILRSKYKGVESSVTISQEGDSVTMIIETAEGHIEEVTQTLKDYALVVRGEMAPEELLDNEYDVLELRSQLRQAYSIIENKRELLIAQGTKIDHLSAEVKRLDHYIKLLAESKNVVNVEASPTLTANQTQTVTVVNEVAALQGSFNELIQNLPQGSEDRTEAEAIERHLDQLGDKAAVRKSATMSRARRFIQDLGDEKSSLGKTVKGLRAGVGIAQDLARTYNGVAEWCGLPQVPKPFLGKGKKKEEG